jgi:predicted outer membrane repeat protein
VGGAIYVNNTADLTLTNAILAGNEADVDGGGIFNDGGSLTLDSSTLSGNSAGYGGGIFNDNGLLMARNLTVSGNSAANFGGGIFSDTDQVSTVVNSTFFNNTATGDGGGFANFDGLSELIHCTLVGNSAPAGGGSGVATIGAPGIETVMEHCIVAGNSNSDVDLVQADISNTFTSHGYNLIGTGDAVANFNATGDTINVSDPQLAPLADYGGPTLTLPPLPGSPAIDAGLVTTNTPATDQRGFARVVGTAVDIGAVEGMFNPNFALIKATALADGTFEFAFSNLNGAPFSVRGSTNAALPISLWSNIGPALEISPGSGQFQFTDPDATNYVQRFYSVTSP